MGSWWSGRRRDASERLGPKIAYVFDEDVNIDNDEHGKGAIAWRYNVAINCFSAEGDTNTFVEQEAAKWRSLAESTGCCHRSVQTNLEERDTMSPDYDIGADGGMYDKL